VLCPWLQHQKQLGRTQYLQVEEFHFFHNDRCSNSPRRRVGAGHGRGQAFNLTAEEAEASEEVVAGIILVHSVPVISLFESGASHCYISTSFIMMHSIPCNNMDTQWEISTGNGIITTSRVCISCSILFCGDLWKGV